MVKPQLTYVAPIWSPTISSSSFWHLQSAQNAALHTITGCYKMPPIDHLHAEASVLPVVHHNTLLGWQFWWTYMQSGHSNHHRRHASEPSRNVQPSIPALYKEAVTLSLSDLCVDSSATKKGFQRLHQRAVVEEKRGYRPPVFLSD
ncbi:unnamed protein product [Dibothriocephalus latus]|uniref:Uncharacterized protein n=1 Tax=Dibothriocephalus latus TaxID=60516 RepID=A0A3P7LWV1_DIBLA|nr:unnamed protein product [Dibothriocephalus latus]